MFAASPRVARASDLVISVCPPHAALAVAHEVAAAGFAGVFVDANAVSPSTAREVGTVVIGAGATFVDGGIVGGPPTPGTSTRLYLAGDGAHSVSRVVRGHAALRDRAGGRPGRGVGR